MTGMPSRILRPVFRLSAESFPKLAAARFGAHEDMDRTWHTFEPVARTLVDSFYTTIDHSRFSDLVPRLDSVESELRGIAYEGAGMGLMLLDSLLPTKNRLHAFVTGPGVRYRCLVYIGAGLVLPRVPRSAHRFVERQDPLRRWFVMDGYGFYRGFFTWRETVNEHRVPARLHGYARRAFDQGLGRSFWFSTGANVERIIDTISGFPAGRGATCGAGSGWRARTRRASWTGPRSSGCSTRPAATGPTSRSGPPSRRCSARSPVTPRRTPTWPAM